MTARFLARCSVSIALAVAAPAALGDGPSWIRLEDEPPQSAEPESSWRFDILPFAWIAGISGSQEADGVEISTGEALVETVTELNFGAMFRAEAGTGDLSLRLAALYLDLDSDATGPGDTELDTNLKGAIIDPSVGYRLLGDPWDKFDDAQRGSARPGFVDALAGVRVMSLAVDLDFENLPSADDSDTWVDPYVGARGRIYAFPWLLLGGEATVGGFGVGSDLVWSAEVVTEFVCSKTVYVALGYTVFDVDYDGGSDGLALDVQIRGPWIGVGFVF